MDGSFETLSLPVLAGLGAAVTAGLAGLTARGAARRRPLETLAPGLALAVLTGTVASYLHSSLRGKFAVWERLLDELELTGAERVLDLGCGRGAVLCAAARRLTRGHAAGVDIWRPDQTGNSPAATWRNVQAEGVAGSVWLLTADITHLPFPDASFDLVVSSLVVHNVPGPDRRAAAIDEASRVLHPGGRLVLVDLAFTREHARRLQQNGLVDVQRRNAGPGMWYGGPYLPAHVVTARRPA